MQTSKKKIDITIDYIGSKLHKVKKINFVHILRLPKIVNIIEPKYEEAATSDARNHHNRQTDRQTDKNQQICSKIENKLAKHKQNLTYIYHYHLSIFTDMVWPIPTRLFPYN